MEKLLQKAEEMKNLADKKVKNARKWEERALDKTPTTHGLFLKKAKKLKAEADDARGESSKLTNEALDMDEED